MLLAPPPHEWLARVSVRRHCLELVTKFITKIKGRNSTNFFTISEVEVPCLSQIFDKFDKYYLRILEINRVLCLDNRDIFTQTRVLVIVITRISSR